MAVRGLLQRIAFFKDSTLTGHLDGFSGNDYCQNGVSNGGPMPIYEYTCLKCDKDFEQIQKFSDPPVKKCPSCGGKVEKKVSLSSFQLKGSGWYATDYARKDNEKKEKEKIEKKEKKEKKEKGEATPSPAKDAEGKKNSKASSPVKSA